MRRAPRVTAIVAGVLAVACTLTPHTASTTLLSRDGAGLTELKLDGRNLRVSWQPRVPCRPAWAGQTNRFGFRYNVYSDASGYAWAPLWSVSAVSAATACVAACIGWRPLRRTRRGRCPSCNYDLTGNMSGVCPECGAPHHNSRPTQRAAAKSTGAR